MSIQDLTRGDNLEGLKKSLSSENIDLKDDNGYSLLHIALANNALRTAEFLINNGISVNMKDSKGQTPLHYTALYNQVDAAKLIIQNGGDLHIKDSYGNDPLWTAVFNVKGRPERYEIVGLYLNSGAEARSKNNAGRSAYDFAKQVANMELINLIEKYS